MSSMSLRLIVCWGSQSGVCGLADPADAHLAAGVAGGSDPHGL